MRAIVQLGLGGYSLALTELAPYAADRAKLLRHPLAGLYTLPAP